MKKAVAAVVCLTFFFSLTAVLCIRPQAASATFTFGVSDPDDASVSLNPPPIVNKQNYNNYYFYYSKKYNNGGKISVSSLKECIYAVNRDSYAMKLMVPQLSDVTDYITNVWPKVADDPTQSAQFWWKIDKLGYACPAGNMCVVIAFKAPKAGKYKVEAKCFGGAKADQGFVADKADGVTFTVNKGGSVVWSKNTGKKCTDASSAIKVPTKTYALSSGEAVYFVVDPNKTFENDLGHWYIKVTQTAVTQSSSSSASSSVTSKKSSSSSAVSSKASSSTASSKASSSAVSSQASSQAASLAESSSEAVSSSEPAPVSSSSEETVSAAGSVPVPQGPGVNPWAVGGATAAVLIVGGGTALYFLKFRK